MVFFCHFLLTVLLLRYSLEDSTWIFESNARRLGDSDFQLAWITRFVKHAYVYPPRPAAVGAAPASCDEAGRDGAAAPPCGAFELCHVRSVTRK